MWCSQEGIVEAALLLLERGADVKKKLPPVHALYVLHTTLHYRAVC